LESGFLIRAIGIATTGTDPATDAIIEIASVDMVRDGGITKPIPLGASAVHHIVDEDVANAPAFNEVIDRLQGGRLLCRPRHRA
jgi:DNA polymerase III epsilon subunit-like protein